MGTRKVERELVNYIRIIPGYWVIWRQPDGGILHSQVDTQYFVGEMLGIWDHQPTQLEIDEVVRVNS